MMDDITIILISIDDIRRMNLNLELNENKQARNLLMEDKQKAEREKLEEKRKMEEYYQAFRNKSENKYSGWFGKYKKSFDLWKKEMKYKIMQLFNLDKLPEEKKNRIVNFASLLFYLVFLVMFIYAIFNEHQISDMNRLSSVIRNTVVNGRIGFNGKLMDFLTVLI